MNEALELIAYRPRYEYLLERALEDEGIPPEQMSFKTDKTCIMVSGSGPIGFFSFRLDEDEETPPRMIHFLLFRSYQSKGYLMTLCRHVCAFVRSLGHSMFIVEVPPDRLLFAPIVRYWSGKENIKPCGTADDGTNFYLLPVVRGGFRNENLYPLGNRY